MTFRIDVIALVLMLIGIWLPQLAILGTVALWLTTIFAVIMTLVMAVVFIGILDNKINIKITEPKKSTVVTVDTVVYACLILLAANIGHTILASVLLVCWVSLFTLTRLIKR